MVLKKVKKAVKKVTKPITKAVKSVGKEAKRFAKSDLGKVALIAGAAYFGGPALMGALGKGGAAAAAGGGSGLLGGVASGGAISGGFMSQVATGGVAAAAGGSTAASAAGAAGLFSKVSGAASGAFGWLNGNPAATNLLAGTLAGVGKGMVEGSNLSKQMEHEKQMQDERLKPRTEAGGLSGYDSHLSIARGGLLGTGLSMRQPTSGIKVA